MYSAIPIIILSVAWWALVRPTPESGDITINGDYIIPNVISVDTIPAIRESSGAGVDWKLLTAVLIPKHMSWKNVQVYNITAGTEISIAGLEIATVSNKIELQDGVLKYLKNPAIGTPAQIEYKMNYIDDSATNKKFTDDSYVRFLDEGYYTFLAAKDNYLLSALSNIIVLNVVCDGTPHVLKPLVAEAMNKELSEFSLNTYRINGYPFVKMRDVAKLKAGTEYRFEITWDKSTDTINLVLGEDYTEIGGELAIGDGLDKTPTKCASVFYINGERIEPTAYIIDNEIYIKHQDLLDYGLIKEFTQEEIEAEKLMVEVLKAILSAQE